jgi:predicted CxxxxCH...CXXCH cytochrome family protein
MLPLVLFWSVAASAVLWAGCLEVRDDGEADGGERSECGDCHHIDWLTPAHRVHTGEDPGLFSTLAMGCEDCHVVTHKDGYRETAVEWFPEGVKAAVGGLAPVWDGARCTDVYCHGGGLSGGLDTEPAWSAVGTIKCNSCHGVPPLAPHPASGYCSQCHGAAYTDGDLDPAKHVDGILDFQGAGQ